MSVIFFYSSIAALWILFFICAVKKPPTFKQLVVAIAAMGYSLLYETTLGEYYKLYYYMNPQKSLFYLILSSILIYPVIEVIYSMFLPQALYPTLAYTAVWIVLMLCFELASVYARVVVFTGWRLIPWSVVTYIVTFSWINLLFRYMKKRCL